VENIVLHIKAGNLWDDPHKSTSDIQGKNE